MFELFAAKLLRLAPRWQSTSAALLLACCGCQAQTPTTDVLVQAPAAGSPAVKAPTTDGPATAAPSVDATDRSAVAHTWWDSCYVHGDKVGYSETSVRPVAEEGRGLLEITSHNQIGIARFGDRNQLDIQTVSVETPAGEVLRFESKTTMAGAPIVVSGKRQGNDMTVKSHQGGKYESTLLPWSDEIRGFHGAEQSLERQPLPPGETRRLKVLMPLINQVVVADVELTAGEYEETPWLEGTQKLQRVESKITLPGIKGTGIQSTMWVDASGNAVKTSVAGLDHVTFRTAREVALAPPQPPKFDLGFDAIVPVDRALPPAFETKRVRYAVSLDGESPAEIFPDSPLQRVTATGEHTAEILVTAPRVLEAAADPGGKRTADLPVPEDSQPSNTVECDDPTIVALAKQARGTETDPRRVCLALEKFVQSTITRKDFSQAFATALQTAQSKQGDCTEHAVLLVALARASQLPARVAVGLVYVEGQQGFGYHMWTEVFLENHWLPLDATLGRGGIGASHLKLGNSSLQGSSAFTSLLSVVQVLGRLKINVLEVE